jgi:hypothetical protein
MSIREATMTDAAPTEIAEETPMEPSDAAATEVIPQLRETPPEIVHEPRRRSRISRFGAWLASPRSRALVYLGLTVVVAGFAVIAFTWSKIAATLSVPLQIPYIASGGFVGVALIVLGVGILSIGVKRRDNFARVREIEKLSSTLESIRDAVGGSDEASNHPRS